MIETEDHDLCTMAELARRIGITRGRVSHYKAAGMPIREDGRVSESECRAWIAANVDPSRSRARGGAHGPAATLDRPQAYGDIKAEHEQLKAERTRLQVDRDKGLIIYRDQAEKAIFERARMERDAWQNWAVRTAPLMAARFQVDEHAMLTALEDAVRDHLQELADTPLEFDA